MERKGDWFLTYTGRQFWPFDPRPDDVCIRDIAHHLAQICRFNGGTRVPYSVAQHSLMVADLLPPPLAFYGLLHDATEAYVGDMVRPLKRGLPEYQRVEAEIWAAIVQKFRIETNPSFTFFDAAGRVVTAEAKVKEADNVALMTERRDLLVPSPHGWSNRAEPHPETIRPLSASEAETRFLQRYDELAAGRSKAE